MAENQVRKTVSSRTFPARAFPLAPLQRGARLTVLAMPVAVLLAGPLLSAAGQQPLPVAAWLLVPLVAALVTLPMWLALRRQRITVHDGQLKIASTFYTRSVPVQDLDLERARIVDLAEHTEFKPRWKSNGFALIGFKSGHYRLRNRAKAFLLVSDAQHVLVLPQRDGTLILLSPQQPRALLDTLRQQQAAR